MRRYKDFYSKERDNSSIDVEDFITCWKGFLNNRFSRPLP